MCRFCGRGQEHPTHAFFECSAADRLVALRAAQIVDAAVAWDRLLTKIEDVLLDAKLGLKWQAPTLAQVHISVAVGHPMVDPVMYTLVLELLLSWRHVRRSNPQPARVPSTGRLLGGLDLEVKPAI